MQDILGYRTQDGMDKARHELLEIALKLGEYELTPKRRARLLEREQQILDEYPELDLD